MNRAQFISSFSAFALTLATGGCEQIAQEIANRPTRKNVANLPANDPILVTYRNAVSQMQHLGAGDVFNWDSQANIHLNNCPHGNWWLLPWHSAYLVYFERICRKLTGDQTFAIPYWNWANNNTVPSVFYNNDVMNDHNDSGSAITVSPEFVAHTVLEPIMQETNFELFASGKVVGQRTRGISGALEQTPHNNVHTSFPPSGDMYQFISPRDPIFWCHHAMLDYCWVDWQFSRGNSNTSDPDWANMTFTEFFDENRNPAKVSVAITPLFAIFDYQYEPSQIGATIDHIQAIKTKADAEKLKAVVQRGAPSKIPVLQRFSLSKSVQVNVGTSALGRIVVPRTTVQAATQVGSGQRALVTLQNVDPPSAADFFVRVFVNAPETVSDKTPITDPHYAGSFGFFLMGGAMPMGGAGYIVDVTNALRRVGASDALDVQLVAVPYPNREVRARGFVVGGLELAIARLGAPASRH